MNNEKNTSKDPCIDKNLHPAINDSDVLYEDEIFEIMDSITEDQDILGDLKLDIDDEAIEENLDFNSIKENVRNKTFKKLGIASDSPVKSITSRKEKFYKTVLFKKLTTVAAAIVVVISLFSSDYVTAAIGKLLQYIPGLNITVEEEGEKFILKKAVNITRENSYIKLISVIIDNKKQNIFVAIDGNNKMCKKVSVKFKNGEIYELPYASIGSGGNEWSGNYAWEAEYNKVKKDAFNYNPGDDLKVILNDKENLTFTVKLEKPGTFQSYDELGPTNNKNGLSITAIPTLNNSELKINLLTPNIPEGRIDEYALRPDYSDNGYSYMGLLAEKMTLKDKNGNTVKGRGLNSYAPPLSEFYFDISNNTNKEFKLTIPYVKVKYDVKKDVKITLPNVGQKLEYENNIVDLKGYKLKINSIEMPENNRVIINFDTNYDENTAESLLEIQPGVRHQLFKKPIYDGWGGSCRINDTNKIGPMNQLDIQLNKKNLHEFTLYIESITTVKKGPWEFDINLNKLRD